MFIKSFQVGNYKLPHKHQNSFLFKRNNTVSSDLFCKSIVNNPSFSGGKAKPIYAITEDGKYQKFDNASVAARELPGNMQHSAIGNCLKGTRFNMQGYTFAYASDVEVRDKNGNVCVSQKLINDIVMKNFHDNALYTLDINGNLTKYRNRNELEKVYGSNFFTSKAKMSDGCVIVNVKDVEKILDDGTRVIDDKKLEKIIDERFYKNAIYMIDSRGRHKRFATRREAAEFSGISETSVSTAVLGPAHFACGYIFVSASEVEFKDDEGEWVANREKIQKYAKALNLKG